MLTLDQHDRELKDWKQLHEMQMNEAARRVAESEFRRCRAERDARNARASEARFKAAAWEAADDAREARRAFVLSEREVRIVSLRCSALERQLALGKAAVPIAKYDVVCAALRAREEEVRELVSRLEELEAVDEVMDEGGDDESCESGEEREEPRPAESTADKLRASCGIRQSRLAPPRQFTGDSSKRRAESEWCKASVKHIHAVVKGRPIEHIAAAIARPDAEHPNGRLGELAACKQFVPQTKLAVSTAVNTLSAHWSARLSVHIWDRLELSREKMETLRHLLSFIYDPGSDKYMNIRVWHNPYDPNDRINAPSLVGRFGREKLFNELLEKCEVTVGTNGRCERDAVRCVSLLYSRFHAAMRDDFSDARPARPIMYFDGTGGSLGKGISHSEIGSADFAGVFRSFPLLAAHHVYELILHGCRRLFAIPQHSDAPSDV